MRLSPFAYACLLFATLCGAYFLVFFQRLSLGVIMPALSADLDLGPAMTGWLGSAFLYGYALTQIPAGLMTDNWGPRRTFLTLFGIGGIGGIIFASATSATGAIIGRTLVGIGMAVVTTASFKLMSRWFSGRVYGALVAIFMAIGGLGTFFAAAPLAILSELFGWREVFWCIAVFSLCWFVPLGLLLKDRPDPEQMKMLGVSEAAADAGAAGFGAFRQLFASRQYCLLLLWYLTCATLFFSFAGLWAGDYYKTVYGLTPQETGHLLSLGAVSLVVGTPFGAWLADRLKSHRVVLGIGSLCALASSISFCIGGADLPHWALWLQFGGICAAGNLTVSPLFAAAREALPVNMLGLSTAMLSFAIFGCTACLQALVGLLLEWGANLPPVEAYAVAFAPYVVFSATSVAVVFLLGKQSAAA